MKNVHLVGRFLGLRGEKSCSASKVGWNSGEGLLRISLQIVSWKEEEGGLFFLKEQLVMFAVVMSAGKLELAPVKIMCVGSNSMIYSAAVTATVYGRSI